jgi:hypothetical protein
MAVTAWYGCVVTCEWRSTLAEPRYLVAPSEVARHLGRDLRHAWGREQGLFDRAHKQLGLSLLIVGVNPSPRPPAHPAGMPWIPSDGFVLRSPSFEPFELPRREPRSIGSGSKIPEYARILSKSLRESATTSSFLELAAALAGVRSSAHEERAEETVSESLQAIRLNPQGEHFGESFEPGDVRIARNAQDYRDLARREGFIAAEAVARSEGDPNLEVLGRHFPPDTQPHLRRHHGVPRG